MSDSLRPHGLQPPRLLRPWDFPGKSTGVGCHFLLQGRTFFEAETPILWPLMWRADSFEKTLMLGKIEGRRRRGGQRMWWLDGITDSMDMCLGELQELVMDRKPGVLWFMGLQRAGYDWVTELNWTESYTGLPWWLSKDCLQCGRPGFDPWVGKIPWRIFLPPEWQPTPVFLPGESPWTEEILAGYCPWGHRVRQLND